MIEGLNGIIKHLERQKAGIERALAALRSVDTPAVAPEESTAGTPESPTRKRRGFSASARKKMALAQKARWAKTRAAIAQPPPALPEPPPSKPRISPEGMKRIIAATKKRWRLKRAAAKAAKKPDTAGVRAPSADGIG